MAELEEKLIKEFNDIKKMQVIKIDDETLEILDAESSGDSNPLTIASMGLASSGLSFETSTIISTK